VAARSIIVAMGYVNASRFASPDSLWSGVKHVKTIMEHSLLNLPRLTSSWRCGQSLHHVNELAEFVVGVLGRIGDRDTVEVLKRFIDDAALGEGAITAIKSIKSHEGDH
jgi:hypothetical protein